MSEPICGIYLIENKLTGQKYVGQSINIHRRWIQHCYNLPKNKRCYVDYAILKYGKENFRFEVIEELPIDQELLNEREVYWIDKFNTYYDKSHYNLTIGGTNLIGENNPFYGKTHSDEVKRKLSKIHKGKTIPEDMKRKLSIQNNGEGNPRYGKPVSEETRKKISEANKGHKFTQEEMFKLSKSKNTTGYYRVTTRKDSHCKQGFVYSYQYPVNKKQKAITSTNLEALREKVIKKGLIWKKIKEEY